MERILCTLDMMTKQAQDCLWSTFTPINKRSLRVYANIQQFWRIVHHICQYVWYAYGLMMVILFAKRAFSSCVFFLCKIKDLFCYISVHQGYGHSETNKLDLFIVWKKWLSQPAWFSCAKSMNCFVTFWYINKFINNLSYPFIMFLMVTHVDSISFLNNNHIYD